MHCLDSHCTNWAARDDFIHLFSERTTVQIAPGHHFHDNQNTDTLHNSLQPELGADI